MARGKKAQVEVEVEAASAQTAILAIEERDLSFCILGASPLIMHRMPEKARQMLLLPARRTRGVKRDEKHNPYEEYRSSVYRRLGDGPTRLVFPANAFKKAMVEATKDVEGTSGASIKRNVWMPDVNVDIYGVPQLLMSVVRMADISRTPDIRTRAIMPEWCAFVRVGHAVPVLRSKDVTTLLARAGYQIGIGDFRQEKGAGSYGRYRLVEPSDKTFKSLVKTAGLTAQDRALATPACFDADTEDLYAWAQAELKRRADDVGGNGASAPDEEDEHEATAV